MNRLARTRRKARTRCTWGKRTIQNERAALQALFGTAEAAKTTDGIETDKGSTCETGTRYSEELGQHAFTGDGIEAQRESEQGDDLAG